MSIAHTVHALLVVALLVPFIGLALLVLALSFVLAWRHPKGRR
jgi:hypothetical protein